MEEGEKNNFYVEPIKEEPAQDKKGWAFRISGGRKMSEGDEHAEEELTEVTEQKTDAPEIQETEGQNEEKPNIARSINEGLNSGSEDKETELVKKILEQRSVLWRFEGNIIRGINDAFDDYYEDEEEV